MLSTHAHGDFESAVAVLTRIWLDTRTADAEAAERASAFVAAQAAGTDTDRLQALSSAFHALRWVLLNRWNDPACRDFTEETLQGVSLAGWPRATRLAEAAWAWARVYQPGSHAQALALLRARQRLETTDPASGGGDPLTERIWLDVALSALHSVAGQHDEALASGLRGEAMAAESGQDLLISVAAQSLAFVYLSAGDIEGANVVLPVAIAARMRCGQPGFGLSFNHLLSLMVSGRFDEAAALLRSTPVLQQQSQLSDFPSLKAMVARVRLSEGRLDEAADLPSLDWTAERGEPHSMAANRLWVSADVLLGLGRHAEARRVLEEGMKTLSDAGVTLSPLNATQCYRALADACEAVGDLPAAMAALRESQRHCFGWVGQSMRARLQALHFSAQPAVAADLQQRQQLRLKLVEQALAAARDAASAEARPHPRDNLLAQVTHEVRNPLHGVVWMTSMLMMSDLDERQREYLDLANSSARMALSLCNDVLDLAKLDAGRFNLNQGPVDLRGLVADVAKVYATVAQSKGVGVHWHCDPGLPAKVSGDRLRLQQVLMNLLSNATKFTHEGRIDVGALWLGAGAVRGTATVRLSVTDTGSGISPSLLPRLFQEFEQGDGEPVHSLGGAGLGLALCRQFVRTMGGEIGVNNRPGTGCTFWCLLPLPAL